MQRKQRIIIITSIIGLTGSYMIADDIMTGSHILTGAHDTVRTSPYGDDTHESNDTSTAAPITTQDPFLPTVDYHPHNDTLSTTTTLVASAGGIHTLEKQNCTRAYQKLRHMQATQNTQQTFIQQKLQRLEQLGCT